MARTLQYLQLPLQKLEIKKLKAEAGKEQMRKFALKNSKPPARKSGGLLLCPSVFTKIFSSCIIKKLNTKKERAHNEIFNDLHLRRRYVSGG